MDVQKSWEKALKSTEIIRTRVKELPSFSDTHVPYIFLSESSINPSDTVVRKGKIFVQKPSIVVPPNNPQFNGFDFEEENQIDMRDVTSFLLVRGVTLPSLKYDNKTLSIDIFEDKLSTAVKHYLDKFQQKEDVSSGLILGAEDCWQFSILIFICSQVMKNADQDFRRLMNEYRKKE